MKAPYLNLVVPMGVGIALAPAVAAAQTATVSAQALPPEVSTIVQQNPFFLKRAQNLARSAAERANGGLEQYRAEPAMHSFSVQAPFVVNSDGSITYRFRGYRPWDIGPDGRVSYSLVSVVNVTPGGRIRIEHNDVGVESDCQRNACLRGAY